VAATARLTVRVTPRADADRVGPFADGVLHARVMRPPADGEANNAVTLLVARALGVPRSSVVLQGGARSRMKRFAIHGVSEADMVARLSAIGD
jgi:uncharacterized protein YggU (UPF0235/DUF167 family)